MEKDAEQLKILFDGLANEWELTHLNWQLTHIENHENVEEIVKLGPEVIPLILERMKSDRLWSIPMEKIIADVFDQKLDVDIMTEGEPEDKSSGRYTHMEGHREACIKWAESNGFLTKKAD
ncbi:MAG: hypothetical protein ACD_61C00155G0002 [uncultured bacterium]|nr:MAG: hypothetical protein ACD_61C00155G0002 [uncultured bacterium]